MSPRHHGGAAVGCTNRVLIGFVERGLCYQLLARGQEPDDVLVDLIDLGADLGERHVRDRT